MRFKKNRAGLLIPILFLSGILGSGLLLSQCTPPDDPGDEDLELLLLAAISNASNLSVAGTWTDTADSNAAYTITNTAYTKHTVLGSGTPKTDYTMSIVSYDNNGIVIKVTGKQLDFAAWPTITEKTNSIYQRSRFAIFDANTIYRCDESFNKNSLAELDADTTAYTFDRNDPTKANGCGAGTWSKMTRR
ncbi:MAG: hypothetical protein KDK39_04690 [Leptospiraceae bacterium]|nr:hypothetical protein [Leptospiraceae bacterium]